MAKQAIILIAGRNKRLRSVTGNNPKCLLNFYEDKLIDIQLKFLIRAGVKRFIIILGYRAEQVKKYLLKNYPANYFIFLYNKSYGSSNVMGSLFFAKKYLSEGGIILHGDVLFSADVILALQKKKTRGAALVVQKKKCFLEEMKYVSNIGGKRIVALSKEINPACADGEFMGITKISSAFGAEMEKILSIFPYESYKNRFYEWGLLQVAANSDLPLELMDATKFPIIEIDFPQDYLLARKKVFPIVSKDLLS